jgi:hypothetical protein
MEKSSTEQRLEAISAVFDIPDFVKGASLDETPIVSGRAYAGDRAYPAWSKATTWFSITDFLMNKSAMDEGTRQLVQHSLKKAASEFGVDYNRLEWEHREKLKSEPEEKFAFVVEKDGETIKLCPINNIDSVKRAAEHLWENRGNYPYPWRQKIARAIIDEKTHYGAITPHDDYLWKAAGYGMSNPEFVADAFKVRATLVDDEEAVESLSKVASDYAASAYDPDLQNTFADVLSVVDEECGLTSLYKKGLATPEEVMFQLPDKDAKAAMEEHITLKNGETISTAQLKDADLKKIARAIGGDFLKEAMQGLLFMTIGGFKTAALKLSKDDADTIVSMLPDRGDSELKDWSFLTKTDLPEPLSRV